MADWSHPRQLRELAEFYELVRANPALATDTEFLEKIEKSFWPTNCWSFAEAAFAIIAPACVMRPHLARQLITYPIDAMVAGGLEDPDSIVSQGLACATKADPYVEPTAEGKRWLLEEWPVLEPLAREVFADIISNNGS